MKCSSVTAKPMWEDRNKMGDCVPTMLGHGGPLKETIYWSFVHYSAGNTAVIRLEALERQNLSLKELFRVAAAIVWNGALNRRPTRRSVASVHYNDQKPCRFFDPEECVGPTGPTRLDAYIIIGNQTAEEFRSRFAAGAAEKSRQFECENQFMRSHSVDLDWYCIVTERLRNGGRGERGTEGVVSPIGLPPTVRGKSPTERGKCAALALILFLCAQQSVSCLPLPLLLLLLRGQRLIGCISALLEWAALRVFLREMIAFNGSCVRFIVTHAAAPDRTISTQILQGLTKCGWIGSTSNPVYEYFGIWLLLLIQGLQDRSE